jgi:hypothetical protein
MITQEIKDVLSKLKPELISKSLHSLNIDAPKELDKQVARFLEEVLDIGIRSFVTRLAKDDVYNIGKALNIHASENEADARIALHETVTSHGVIDFIKSLDLSALNRLCNILDLPHNKTM